MTSTQVWQAAGYGKQEGMIGNVVWKATRYGRTTSSVLWNAQWYGKPKSMAGSDGKQ